MIRRIGGAALLLILGLMTDRETMAQSGVMADLDYGDPFPAQGVLRLGGLNGLVVDPSCQKRIRIRDLSGSPIPNCPVIIEFGACYTGGDIRVANDQPFPGVTVNCGPPVTVTALTDINGIAVFRILGYSNVMSSTAAGAGEGCAVVSAGCGNAPLGSYSVATPDMNGALGGSNLGMSGSDTVLYWGNRFGGPSAYRPRANLARAVNIQVIDGSDTTIFTGFRFGGGSISNGPTPCP
jgi:hypothetical protein